MTETFTPPRAPRVGGGVSIDETARILEASFGDGYEQRAGDGINNVRVQLPLSWAPMYLVDADAIVAFFRARRGYEAFYWTAPGESAPRLWKCKAWSKTEAGTKLIWTVQATFDEVFDIV